MVGCPSLQLVPFQDWGLPVSHFTLSLSPSLCLTLEERITRGKPLTRSPNGVKSPSETRENCRMRTKCCCLLYSSFDLSTLFTSCSLLLSLCPPIFHLLLPDSQICFCAPLNQPNKGCTFRFIKNVSLWHSLSLSLCQSHTQTVMQCNLLCSKYFYKYCTFIVRKSLCKPNVPLILHHRIEQKKEIFPGFLLLRRAASFKCTQTHTHTYTIML